jgi:hypothetical protein
LARTKRGRVRMSQAYWVSHDYTRLSVKKYVEEFCGWTALKQLSNYVQEERDKGFLCALFESGGRAQEVLALERERACAIQFPD